MKQFGLFIVGKKEMEKMSEFDIKLMKDSALCDNDSEALMKVLAKFGPEYVEEQVNTDEEDFEIIKGMNLEKGGIIRIDHASIKETCQKRYEELKSMIDKMSLEEFMVNKNDIIEKLENHVMETIIVYMPDVMKDGLSGGVYTATDFAISRLSEESEYVVLGAFKVDY